VKVSARSLLFDLDGTLLDTAPDLAEALNATLTANGREPLPFEAIRPVVSHGGRALIERGFGMNPDEPGFERLRRQLLDYYENHICDRTRLFPGMEDLLRTLEQRNIPWGVVTNKPGWLTNPLMHCLGLMERAATVISGDTLNRSKPDPAPLLHACIGLGIEPERCIYIGDAERDILAGRNAGMRTLVALFGYLADDDRPEHWQADGMIAHPMDALDWLEKD
jgi:phosphoglycolate phosphatase